MYRTVHALACGIEFVLVVYVIDKYLILVFLDVSVICLLVNKVKSCSNSTVGSAIQ